MPIQYLESNDLHRAAELATELAKIIRQWLPIKGVKKTVANRLTIDRWYSQAGELFIEFRRFNPTRGRFATSAPQGVADYWRELCHAMYAIEDHYKWRDVEGETRLPFSNVRHGEKILAIDAAIVATIETAAGELLQSLRGCTPKPDSRLPIVRMEKGEIEYAGKTYTDQKTDSMRLLAAVVNNHPKPVAASKLDPPIIKPCRSIELLPAPLKRMMKTSGGKGVSLQL